MSKRRRSKTPMLHSRFKRIASGILVPETFSTPLGKTQQQSDVEVFLDHKAVFPSERGDFDEFKKLVRQLSRTDAIIWCARINLLISDSTHRDRKEIQSHCIGTFFTEEEIRRINSFVGAHGGRDRCTVFFRGQLLELIRWIALLSIDLRGDGETFNSPDVRRIFARAVLLASDIWQRRVYGDRLSIDAPIDEIRRALSQL